MKKLFTLALACSLFTVNANAQTETYYGGEQGSFAVTVGADPVINFVGNMFNGNLQNSLEGLGAELAGKYFVTDNFVLNAELGINNSKSTSFVYGNYEEEKDVTSKSTVADNSFSLGIGAQYLLRPGKRLQPFVGANVLYGRMNSYTLDKSFGFKNDWTEQFDETSKEAYPTNVFGLQANLGVEYYLRQNISISASLDLGVYTATQKTVSKFETDDRDTYNKEAIEAMNYAYKTSKGTFFGTGLMNGNIAFNFYF